MKQLLCLSVLITVIANAPALARQTSAQRLPKDVVAFQERRAQCDHFRGEQASGPQRRNFLMAALKRTCSGTDAQLKRLKRKYARDKAITRALGRYQSRIE